MWLKYNKETAAIFCEQKTRDGFLSFGVLTR